jgi:hypothetical protein
MQEHCVRLTSCWEHMGLTGLVLRCC